MQYLTRVEPAKLGTSIDTSTESLSPSFNALGVRNVPASTVYYHIGVIEIVINVLNTLHNYDIIMCLSSGLNLINKQHLHTNCIIISRAYKITDKSTYSFPLA